MIYFTLHYCMISIPVSRKITEMLFNLNFCCEIVLYLNLHSSKNQIKNQSQLSFEKYDEDLFLVIFFPNSPSDLFLVIPATFTQLEDPGVRLALWSL